MAFKFHAETMPSLAKHLSRDVIPLHPFLKEAVEAEKNASIRSRRRIHLKNIEDGLLPNGVDWCRKYGTPDVYVADKPIEGRWLFNHDEPEVKDT
ncbi:MAG: hypothetical protein LPL29_14530 [Alphaproteobacteria bacterium]|nr:hypothetical protein [Alphaproteobacteria bacterium]